MRALRAIAVAVACSLSLSVSDLQAQYSGPIRNPVDDTAMQAQSLGIPEIVLGGVVVSKLLEQFEDTASRLISQGENSGNALLVALGNQLRVATQNAELVMQRQQNVAFDRLNVTQQTFFTELNNIIRAANGPIDRAISVLEVANLDLIELTNRLPLTDKTYTYINKVSGLTQPHSSGTYQIQAMGLGFGQDLPNRKYRLGVSVKGTPVALAAITRTPPYTMNVALDRALLEPFFEDGAVKTVPLTLGADVTARERCWLFFRCTRRQNASWDLGLVLLPRYPGQLEGVEVLTGEALDGVTKTTSVDVTTSGCSSKRPCDWSRTIQLAQNERAIGVRYACSGQCGWSYNMRHGGYAPDFDILEGGTKVVVYRHVDGHESTTVTHYVDYQTMKTTVTELPITPLRLAFGEIATLKLSQGNSACTYRLNAKLVTKQNVFIDNSMSASPDGLLVRIGTGQGPGGAPCAPTFKLNIP